MTRAADIVALRALGFGLAEVARILKGDLQVLEPALAAHQAVLEGRLRDLGLTVEKVRALRDDLGRGQPPTAGDLARLLGPAPEWQVAFDLPWPWGGERFELRDIRPLTYVTGPLGSGKTRLAKRLAETLPDAAFLGLDRLSDDGAPARSRLDADPALKSRVDRALARLVEDGAQASDALVALLVGLESEGPSVLVIDMVEQGLDKASQEALVARLRRRGPGARPLFVLTRFHRHPGSRRRRRRRGDHPLPRQPQRTASRRALSWRSGLRGPCLLPGVARRAGAHRGRDRVAADRS
jgi:hypothetical protein